jgi:hypothetical protein
VYICTLEALRESYVGRNGLLYKDAIGTHKKTSNLVLEAFVGSRPLGMDACHCNGDPHDNRVENLRWDTRKGNFADREAHGNTAKGARNGFSKLTENAVIEIRKDTRSNRQIAKTYNVSSVCIDKIKNRTNWKHI